jgi:D-alanine-D-alanine ligase
MTEKTKVIVIYGGKSAEHEISCRSAAFVFKNLDRSKYELNAIAIDQSGKWIPQDVQVLLENTEQSVPIGKGIASQPALDISNDPGSRLLSLVPPASKNQKTVVIPILHGSNGEDGTIQGLFELTEVAYVGCDHLGSSMSMDKVIAKKMVQAAGLKVVPWVDVKRQNWDKDQGITLEACKALTYPLFVKPINCGSSVGITKVASEADLGKAIDFAFEYDTKVMIETGLDVREIECAVMGDYDPEVSIPGEIEATKEFYTYEAKYIDDDGARIQVPADLSKDDLKKAQDMSVAAFKALDLYGMARVDLFLDKNDGEFYFNEVNTIPGFTEISQFPQLWIKSGKSAAEILDRLIELGLKRQQLKANLKRTH